jgi:hypothetical protein
VSACASSDVRLSSILSVARACSCRSSRSKPACTVQRDIDCVEVYLFCLRDRRGEKQEQARSEWRHREDEGNREREIRYTRVDARVWW